MRVCVYGPLNCFCPRETDKTAIEEEEEERKENTDVINTSMVRAFKNIKIKRLERAIERETSNVSSATHRSTDVGISLRNRHFFFALKSGSRLPPPLPPSSSILYSAHSLNVRLSIPRFLSRDSKPVL